MTPIQMRIDGAVSYGLPVKPELLAKLNPFELGHVLLVLGLDAEQTACVEQAVAAVRAGSYPRRAPA
jgi:hypothetical protein